MYNPTLMHPVCSSFALLGGLLRCFSAVVQAPAILMGGMFAFASFYYLGSNNIHICVCEVKALSNFQVAAVFLSVALLYLFWVSYSNLLTH
jgi:hypothetical protein